MKYTEEDQINWDIEWFAIDVKGNIAHFSIGDARLPISVVNSKEDNDKLIHYFKKAPSISNMIVVIPLYRDYIQFENKTYEEWYINSAKEVASKGIIDYDSQDYPNENIYFCVTVPEKRLNIKELPSDIQELLKRTQWKKGTFDEYPIIDSREIE